jgi:deoxyribonuclease IV
MLLGAHVPTAGGLALAPANGRQIEATAIQVFTRNQRQWASRPLAPAEVQGFRDALPGSGVRALLSHASYLINLASLVPEALARSRQTMVEELRRCHALGIPYAIVHPGAHMGAGEAAGLRSVARSLDHVMARTRGLTSSPVLEVTAGQGSCLAHRFEHLEEVLGQVRDPDRVGVCLDTCHLLAAGYDLATPRGYERTLAEFERRVGFHKLKAIHLNDAKLGLGSRRDRHAPVGEGHLGLRTFARILNDPRLAGVPMVLETPGGLEAWRRELVLLRKMRRRRRVA